MNYREKIRKAIDCPQFGGNNYGEWGALRFEQRILIKRLLDDLDNTDECVKSLYEENQQLKIQISAREEEYKKLEDSWNRLKEYIYNQIPTDKTVLTKHIKIFEVLDKMQELERGVSDVED